MTPAASGAAARVAIVTGAGSGIGRATAELFLARGCRVVAVDLNDDSLAWTAGHADTVALPGDVSLDATNAAAVAIALEAFGRLDVAVLNAGMASGLGFEVDGSLERLDQLLAVNVRSVASGIRNAAPAMRATSDAGAIVATASTAGFSAPGWCTVSDLTSSRG